MSLAAQCMVVDWPAPANIRTLMTTRAGGVSSGPFASLNLGMQVGDAPEHVVSNREVLQQCVGAPVPWVSQVHGTTVVRAGWGDAIPTADAVWADLPGQVCAVQMADCLPVLLTSRDGGTVAAAHAGWRGLAAGVIESTVAATGCEGRDLMAWLGPAIGPDAFEVGAEVRAAFVTRDPGAGAAFRERGNGKYLADLFTLARMRLMQAGVTAVFGGGLCTYSDPARFFSFRRDRTTGRMAALIWIESQAEA